MASKRDDLPPALASMWRLCKLGYRHEPGLLLAAFLLSLLAALPDALVAVWIALLGDGVLHGNREPHTNRGNRAGGLGYCNMVVADGQYPRAAPVSRQSHHRVGITRREVASVGEHHRAPRATGLSRSARDVAQPGLCSRSHVHVAFFDLRVDPAARHHGSSAGINTPGAHSPRSIRASDRSGPRRGGRKSSAMPGRAKPHRNGWLGICLLLLRPLLRARKCESPESALD